MKISKELKKTFILPKPHDANSIVIKLLSAGVRRKINSQCMKYREIVEDGATKQETSVDFNQLSYETAVKCVVDWGGQWLDENDNEMEFNQKNFILMLNNAAGLDHFVRSKHDELVAAEPDGLLALEKNSENGEDGLPE